MNTDKLVFGIIGGITLLITIIIIATSFSTTSSSDLQAQELIGNNPHIKGAENARLTIVEFSDFECPYCAQYEPTLNGLLAEYPNDLALVYRHYPLPSHTGALPAARASEAAANQGKFWEYSSELFANQPNFTQADLEQYAEIVGLNIDQFKADYANSEVIARVQEDADYGRSLNIGGTPTFYVIYDGKAEFVKLQQSDDLEIKIRSILGEPTASSDSEGETVDENSDENSDENVFENGSQTDSGGPSVTGQVPEGMPSNIPLNVTLDIINTQRDDVAPSQVSVVSVTEEEWPAGDLGCPVDGQVYPQVVTSGYKILAEANGETFEYHTTRSAENLVFCGTL